MSGILIGGAIARCGRPPLESSGLADSSDSTKPRPLGTPGILPEAHPSGGRHAGAVPYRLQGGGLLWQNMNDRSSGSLPNPPLETAMDNKLNRRQFVRTSSGGRRRCGPSGLSPQAASARWAAAFGGEARYEPDSEL